MDYVESLQELNKLNRDKGEAASEARIAYGNLKADLDVALAGEFLGYMEIKKNLGIEAAHLMLIAKKPEYRESYRQMIQKYNEYLALEKVVDSYKTNIQSIQSIMRWNLQGEIKGE